MPVLSDVNKKAVAALKEQLVAMLRMACELNIHATPDAIEALEVRGLVAAIKRQLDELLDAVEEPWPADLLEQIEASRAS